MKNIMSSLMILVVLLSVGCSMGMDYGNTDIEMFMIENGIDTQEKVLEWVSRNIDYVRDIEQFGIRCHQQSPEEIFYRRSGDELSISILIQNMLNVININSNIMKIHIIESFSTLFVIEINNTIYDPITCTEKDLSLFNYNIIYHAKSNENVGLIASCIV